MKDLDDVSMSTMETDDEVLETKTDKMKERLLSCVARSDGFFKNQQIGEKDLTFEEKRDIAEALLVKNVPLFLQRYWKFIKLDDIPFFDADRDSYEVSFYLSEIFKYQNSRTNKVKVRNRRYEALKKMVEEGSYFSDGEMKKRNPFLYDQMIGQHLTENERVAAYKEQHQDERFSTFLMEQMERNAENCLFEKQKEEDEAVVEEDDDSSEEESELEDEEPVKKIITDQEKSLLRNEFTNIMYESFLAGKDKEFDYSAVDENVEYDSVQQREFDEQEKYFDDESSHSIHDSD